MVAKDVWKDYKKCTFHWNVVYRLIKWSFTSLIHHGYFFIHWIQMLLWLFTTPIIISKMLLLIAVSEFYNILTINYDFIWYYLIRYLCFINGYSLVLDKNVMAQLWILTSELLMLCCLLRKGGYSILFRKHKIPKPLSKAHEIHNIWPPYLGLDP